MELSINLDCIISGFIRTRKEIAVKKVAKILTSRETEIATQLAKGQKNKEIARQLNLTEGTVKAHLHNIYEKLNLNGRLELVKYIQDSGLDY